MPKVFTGRVAIPGDKIDDFFTALQKAEEERAPFRDQLMLLNEEFGGYLMQKFSQQTAYKHSGTIQMFIEFLCRQTDVNTLQEVTAGIANSHFRTWYKRKVLDSSTESDLKAGVKKFFRFLADEKGIENQKVLNSFGPPAKKAIRSKAKSSKAGTAPQTTIIRAKVIGNKRTYRDIEILSDATLYALAEAILSSFHFGMDHAFGFYATNKAERYYDAPMRYELFTDMGEPTDEQTKGVKRTKIAHALTEVGQKMAFLFDYGDEWLFELELRSFGEKNPRGKYPKVLLTKGTAPSQYGD